MDLLYENNLEKYAWNVRHDSTNTYLQFKGLYMFYELYNFIQNMST